MLEVTHHVKERTQHAVEAMSQGLMPCTSAKAMLPVTSENIAEAGAMALRHSGAQSVMLSAVLGIFILAAAAALFLFQMLEKQEAARRHAGAGMLGTPVTPELAKPG